MSTPSRVLGALVALVTVGAVFVCVLYALTEPAQRTDLLGKLAPMLVGVVAGVPALIGALNGRELHATVKRVEHQTNGSLTKRMHEVVSEQLDARGLTVPATDSTGAGDPGAGEWTGN